MKDDKDKDKYKVMRAFSLFSQLGINMASCIIIGIVLGEFLDKLFGTTPILLIVCIIIGSIATIKVLYDHVKDWE